MDLHDKFSELVRNLVYQEEEELAREQTQTMDEIMEDSASRGWEIPPGHVHGAFDDFQVEAIRRKKDIVWSAIEEAIKAFDPPSYPELPDELYTLCESFFPESLCEPHDYLRAMGWKRPFAERTQKQLREQLESARHSALHILKTKIDLFAAKKRSISTIEKHPTSEFRSQTEWDLFICHASEDKEDFVGPLAEALRQRKIRVWYDKFCIKWGDSIRQAIDEGLRSSKFGIVIFSQAFFRKKWPQNELDALYQRMNAGEARILPIWHGITESELTAHAPLLSGILARTSNHGIEALSDEIVETLRGPASPGRLETNPTRHQSSGTDGSAPPRAAGTITHPREGPNQSLCITGSTITGQIAQAAGAIGQSQRLASNRAGKQPGPADILAAIAAIATLIEQSGLPANHRDRATTHLAAARVAITEDEPDKKYIAISLNKAMESLREGGESHESIEALLDRVSALLQPISPWLDVPPGFFGL